MKQMDFSYLDKKEYSGISLLDESMMNPASPDTEQFFIRKYRVNSDARLHRHTYIQINYVCRGRGHHIVNNRKTEISKGDIFIIPPYVPHLIVAEDETGLEIFEFEFVPDFVLPTLGKDENAKSCLDFAYLEPFIVAEEEIKPRFNLDAVTRCEVEEILFEALEEYTAKNAGYALVAKALLLKLLVITGRAYSRDIKGTRTEEILNRYKSTIFRASQYIESNYSKELGLDAICSEINYSKSYFCYLFKAVTGKTYVEYLNEVRISNACRMLSETDMNIGDISFEVGYKTIANFNKYFKIFTGTTPSKYRLQKNKPTRN